MSVFRLDILDWIKSKVGKRLVRYTSPVPGDAVVVEKGTFKKDGYVRTPYGTAHPTLAGMRLVDEVPSDGDDNQVSVIYTYSNATGAALQNIFNALKTFSGEANSYPIWARTYRNILRSEYERTGPATKGAALTSLIGADITAGGSGYANSFAVAFTGGAGSGAAATAYALDGVITNIVITNAGSGYTSAPTMSLSAGAGTGGAATALLQPASAVLVSEQAARAEGADGGLFVDVTRIYETLPGPWITLPSRYDEALGWRTIRQRAVRNTGQTPAITATTKTSYGARDGSSIVSLETEETNSDGTGSAGNPAFPINDGPDFEDPVKGKVTTVNQLATIADPPQDGSLTSSGGVVTNIRYEPFDNYRFKKVTEKWPVTGTLLAGTTQNSRGIGGVTSSQLVAPGTAATTGADVAESSVEAVSSVQSEKKSETGVLWSTGSGLAVVFGIQGTVSEAVASAASVSTGIDIESSTGDPQDALRFRNRTVTIPFSSTTIASKVIGRRGFVADHARKWTAPSATPTVQSPTVEVEVTLESKDRRREDAMTYADGSPILTKDISRFGGVDVATDTIVAPSTTPAVSTASTYIVEKLIQQTEKEARLISKVIATGNAISVTEKADPRVIGSQMVIEYSIVVATTSIPADTNVITYERLEHPEHPLLRIQKKTTTSIPDDFVEWINRPFSYPSYFVSLYSDDLEGTTRLGRGSFSIVVPHKVTHHFSAPTLGTTPAPPSPYIIIENDYLLFSNKISGLMDAGTAYRTTNGVTYSRAYAASSPTLAVYQALVAGSSLMTIGGGVEVWRAGIFEKTTIEVPAY